MAVPAREWGWERYSPLAGVVAVVLWVIGMFVRGEGDNDTAAESLAYFGDDDVSILAAGVIFLIGTLFFIWFLGALRARLFAAEGGIGRLSTIAFASGIATSIFLLALPGGDMTGALADQGDLTDSAAQALDALELVFFIGAEFAAIPMLAAVALVILRTRALPVWLAWISLLLALLLVIAPIGWIGLIFGLPLWTLITSFLLWRTAAPVAAEPPPARVP